MPPAFPDHCSYRGPGRWVDNGPTQKAQVRIPYQRLKGAQQRLMRSLANRLHGLNRQRTLHRHPIPPILFQQVPTPSQRSSMRFKTTVARSPKTGHATRIIRTPRALYKPRPTSPGSSPNQEMGFPSPPPATLGRLTSAKRH